MCAGPCLGLIVAVMKGVSEYLFCKETPCPGRWHPVLLRVLALPAASEASLGQVEFGEAGEGASLLPSMGLHFLRQLIT